MFVTCFREPLISNLCHIQSVQVPPSVGERCYVADTLARRLLLLTHGFQFFYGVLVVRNRFSVLLVGSQAVRKHSPCLKQKPIALRFGRQVQSASREGYTLRRCLTARLAGIELRAPNVVPHSIECLL